MQSPTFVDIIQKVESHIFNLAIEEIANIDWESVRMRDIRNTNPAFATCITLPLRLSAKYKNPVINSTQHILNESEIIEAKDAPWINKYPALQDIISWVYSSVNGIRLGRVMLVNLLELGTIPLHIDPGKYFNVYKRFHVVFKTSPEVVFIGKEGTTPTHMPYGYLCQLNNIDYHGVISKSLDTRIHLIVDIETTDERFSVTRKLP